MSTLVIDAQAEVTTSVTIFAVDPDRQRELVDLLVCATEELIRHQPGFIAASAHLSADGTRVLNYVQWESAAAVRAMLDDPACHARLLQAKAIGRAEASHYTVASTIRG